MIRAPQRERQWARSERAPGIGCAGGSRGLIFVWVNDRLSTSGGGAGWSTLEVGMGVLA
jgi:hypothetical protein